MEVFEGDGVTEITTETIENSDIEDSVITVALDDVAPSRPQILGRRAHVASGSTIKVRFVVRDVEGGRERLGTMATVIIGQRSLVPRLSLVSRTSSGYTIQVTNYNSAFTFSSRASSGRVRQDRPSGSTIRINVTGLRPGNSSTLTVTSTRRGYARGEFALEVTTLRAGLASTFSRPSSIPGGFTVNVSNYDAAYRYIITTSAGSVSVGTAVGRNLPITVSGLRANTNATLTVATTRIGYEDLTRTVRGRSARR